MIRPWRVPATRPDPDFFFPTRTGPGKFFRISGFRVALLLALVLVKLRNTCKKEMNRKKLEGPNICYIFEKLVVQGWQIWHSQVSIPFNSSPQCKKSSLRHHFRRNSWKLGSQKLHVHAHFWCTCKFSFSPVFTEKFGTFGLFLSFFVSKIWQFKVEIPVRATFSLYF